MILNEKNNKINVEVNNSQRQNLSSISVAIMYVGTIMGAGFASGREIWQFFGVFESKAYIGIALIAVLFVVFGMMASFIARKLDTNDMGKIIVPSDNPKIVNLFGYFMALIMFTVLITMSSAGGSIFKQQLGMSPYLGGIVVIILVLLTVLGEFHRVSKVFRYIMPILFTVVMIVSISVIIRGSDGADSVCLLRPSPMASTWFLAAWLYISYNILAMIPIIATSSINAKSLKSAISGTALGGVLLGCLALVIVIALQTDMNMSQTLDLPMLGFSVKISEFVGLIYGITLFLAVYSAATSNYYGFTTKLKEGKNKKRIIIITAIIGYCFGLVGFKNVIAYMFPAEGFIGFLIMAMLTINFGKVLKREICAKQETSKALEEKIE